MVRRELLGKRVLVFMKTNGKIINLPKGATILDAMDECYPTVCPPRHWAPRARVVPSAPCTGERGQRDNIGSSESRRANKAHNGWGRALQIGGTVTHNRSLETLAPQIPYVVWPHSPRSHGGFGLPLR